MKTTGPKLRDRQCGGDFGGFEAVTWFRLIWNALAFRWGAEKYPIMSEVEGK